MFLATGNKGFQMTFANGFTVSVQWGPHNYGGSRNLADNPMKKENYKCEHAEIAAWKEKEWLQLGENDGVVGWLNPDEVAKIINLIQGINPFVWKDMSELSKHIRSHIV